MSSPHADVDDDADRLVRVRLSGAIEPGDLRVTGLVSELGAVKVLDYLAADLDQLAANAVAVVGSRAATNYGTDQATELSRDLATKGRTVVSGLAYGVDQAAHRGALLAGGPTIAVMPCGADRPYPAAHSELLEAIAERGLVVAEAPPGAAPTRARFLIRNRSSPTLQLTQTRLRPRPISSTSPSSLDQCPSGTAASSGRPGRPGLPRRRGDESPARPVDNPITGLRVPTLLNVPWASGIACRPLSQEGTNDDRTCDQAAGP